MPRQSISLTEPSSAWLKRKVEVEGEYGSNSEAVNDLIQRAREIEAIRARLIEMEKSGFADRGSDSCQVKRRIAAGQQVINSRRTQNSM